MCGNPAQMRPKAETEAQAVVCLFIGKLIAVSQNLLQSNRLLNLETFHFWVGVMSFHPPGLTSICSKT
jgi:hypothetical protein